MSLFLGENQYFYKNNPIFLIGQVKLLKCIVCIYLVLRLKLHFSTYIYSVVLTYAICHFFPFLPRKLTFFCSGIFFEMHVLLFHIYQGIGIL